MFIDAERARAIAVTAVATGPAAGDPQFRAWKGAAPGAPLLVHDLSSRPSYWLVPVLRQGQAVGAVRVAGDGRVTAVLALREGAAVSSIDAAEAARRARREIDAAAETAGEPALVHDGPPGREAWRIEVLKTGRPVRWIFVTPGGTYSRPAGELGGEALE